MDHHWCNKRKRPRTETEEEANQTFVKKFRAYVNGSMKSQKITTSHNNVYFYSDVTRESVYNLIDCLNTAKDRCLSVAKNYGIEPPPIKLYIHSYGGSVFSALAAVDAIRDCEVPVHTIIEGCAASAATMISVVADRRFMKKNAKMLIHQLSSSFWGKMDDIEEELVNLRSLMDTIKGLYKEYSKVPSRKLDEILKHDLWWDADLCLKYKLIDEVV